MKPLNFIFLICVNVSFAYTQTINLGITNRYEGEGKIDKYEVSFILDYISRPYYIDGDHVGEIQQFSGKYYYKKFEEDIFLFGTRLIIFTQGEPIMEDTIMLYEVDDKLNKVAIFKGVLSKNSFEGIWNRKDSEKKLFFKIHFDESKFTEIQVKTSNGYIILPITHFYKYNQNKFEILKIIEEKNKTYVLVKLWLTVCGAIKARGSGCGGHITFLRLYEIEKKSIKYSDVTLDGYLNEGGVNSFQEDHALQDGYTVNIVCFNKGQEFYKRYKVDYNKIHEGIKEIKL